nr:PREDICTED: uncharacterized protein LOC109031053 isoform X1 [Bemisia tabaci]
MDNLRIVISNIGAGTTFLELNDLFAKYGNAKVISLVQEKFGGDRLRAFVDFSSQHAINQARKDLSKQPPGYWEFSEPFRGKKTSFTQHDSARGKSNFKDLSTKQHSQENINPNMDIPRSISVNYETGVRRAFYGHGSQESSVIDFTRPSYEEDYQPFGSDTSFESGRGPLGRFGRNERPPSQMDNRYEQNPYPPRNGGQFNSARGPFNNDYKQSFGRGAMFSPDSNYNYNRPFGRGGMLPNINEYEYGGPRSARPYSDYGSTGRGRGRGAPLYRNNGPPFNDYGPGPYPPGNPPYDPYQNDYCGPSPYYNDYGTQASNYDNYREPLSNRGPPPRNSFGKGGPPPQNYSRNDRFEDAPPHYASNQNEYYDSHGDFRAPSRAVGFRNDSYGDSHVDFRAPSRAVGVRNDSYRNRNSWSHETSSNESFSQGNTDFSKGRASPTKTNQRQKQSDSRDGSRLKGKSSARERPDSSDENVDQKKGYEYKEDADKSIRPKSVAAGSFKDSSKDAKSQNYDKYSKQQGPECSSGGSSSHFRGTGLKKEASEDWTNNRGPKSSVNERLQRKRQDDQTVEIVDDSNKDRKSNRRPNQEPSSNNLDGARRKSDGDRGKQKRQDDGASNFNGTRQSNFSNEKKDNAPEKSRSRMPSQKDDNNDERSSQHASAYRKDGRADRTNSRAAFGKKDGEWDRPKSRGGSEKRDSRGPRKGMEAAAAAFPEPVNETEEDILNISSRKIEINGDGSSMVNGEVSMRSQKFGQQKHGTCGDTTSHKHSEKPHADSSTASTSAKLSSGTFTKVFVSHRISPGFFFVQSTADANKICKLTSEISNISDEAPPLKEVIVGAKCLAQYKDDKLWYRAHVKKINKEEVTVGFIDYGNLEICQKAELKELPSQLASVKPLAFKIRLLDESPKEAKFTKNNETLDVRLVEKRDGGIWLVEAKEKRHSHDDPGNSVLPTVSDKLKELEVGMQSSKPSGKSTAEPACPLPTNEYSEVVVQVAEAPNIFYVHTMEGARKSLEYMKKIASTVEQQRSLSKISKDLNCLAFFKEDNNWYRAKILDYSEEDVSIAFIDYGNREKVNPSMLKELPQELQGKPLAIKIKLSETTSSAQFNKKFGDKLQVKPTSRLDDGTWNVEVLNSTTKENNNSRKTASKEVAKEGSPPAAKKTPSDTFQEVSSGQNSSESKSLRMPKSATCPIDTKTVSEVIFTCARNNFYFGHPSTKAPELLALQKSMLNQGSLGFPLADPQINDLCAVKVEQDWCRGRITHLTHELTPEVTVFLIDYGDLIVFTVDKLKVLPVDLETPSGFVSKFEIAGDKKVELFKKIKVKPVKRSDKSDCWILAVQEDASGPKSSDEKPMTSAEVKTCTSSLPPVSRTCPLPQDLYTEVSVLCLVRDDTYYGQPATLLRDTNLLHEELQAQADKIDNFCLMKDIAVGSLCLVKYSGDWYRAEILSIAPLKVQLLDYGDCISCPAENLREIPTELKPRSRTIFKFKLAENASKKYYKKSVYSCLKIKPLHFSEKDNSWVVAVEGDPCPPTSLNDVTEKKPSVQPGTSPVKASPKSDIPAQNTPQDQCPVKENVSSTASNKHSVEKSPVEVTQTQKPTCPIDRNSFTEVTVTSVQKAKSGVFFGRPSSCEEEMIELLKVLHSVGKNCAVLEKPAIGDICFALYEELWYRGRIIAVDKQVRTVELIDYGDVITIPFDYVGVISDDLKSKPITCFKWRFVDGTSPDLFPKCADEKIILKPVQYDEELGGWIMTVNMESSSVQPPSVTIKVPPIPADEFTSVTTTSIERAEDGIFFGQPSSHDADMVKLSQILQRVGQTCEELINPAIGDLCFAFYEQEWYRGRIVAVDEKVRTVQLIDYGDEVSLPADCVGIIPDDLKNKPVYCFKWRFVDGTSPDLFPKKFLASVALKPVQYDEEFNSWIMAANEGCDSEIPILETKLGLSCLDGGRVCPLPSDKYTTVIITCPVRQNVFYCQNQELEDEMAAADKIVQSEGHNAVELKNGKQNDFCLVQYLSRWWRAKILSIEPDPILQLIDVGDVIKASVKELKKLGPKLLAYPCFSIKIMFSKKTSPIHFNKNVEECIAVKPVKFSEEYNCWIVEVDR